MDFCDDIEVIPAWKKCHSALGSVHSMARHFNPKPTIITRDAKRSKTLAPGAAGLRRSAHQCHASFLASFESNRSVDLLAVVLDRFAFRVHGTVRCQFGPIASGKLGHDIFPARNAFSRRSLGPSEGIHTS